MVLRSGIRARVMTRLGLRPRLDVLFRIYIVQFYAFHIVQTRKGNDVKIRIRAKG